MAGKLSTPRVTQTEALPTEEWEIELVAVGRDGGSTAKVFLPFDPGVDSVVALALLALQAERRVGEMLAAAQVATSHAG
nr:hypothetical protein [Actinomycetota bacterium]